MSCPEGMEQRRYFALAAARPDRESRPSRRLRWRSRSRSTSGPGRACTARSRDLAQPRVAVLTARPTRSRDRGGPGHARARSRVLLEERSRRQGESSGPMLRVQRGLAGGDRWQIAEAASRERAAKQWTLEGSAEASGREQAAWPLCDARAEQPPHVLGARSGRRRRSRLVPRRERPL